MRYEEATDTPGLREFRIGDYQALPLRGGGVTVPRMSGVGAYVIRVVKRAWRDSCALMFPNSWKAAVRDLAIFGLAVGAMYAMHDPLVNQKIIQRADNPAVDALIPWLFGLAALVAIFAIVFVFETIFIAPYRVYRDDVAAAVEVKRKQQRAKIRTLRETFDSDFAHLLKQHLDMTFTDNATGKRAAVRLNRCADFDGRAAFAMVYFPGGIVFMPVFEKFLDIFEAEFAKMLDVGVKLHQPGDFEPIESEDLVFTGRLYVYHETHIPIPELAKAQALCLERGLHPIFRGQTYLTTLRISDSQQAVSHRAEGSGRR